jgi:hypothetical protein
MACADALETHYALVAQYLAQFPPKLQSQLVDQTGSYTALFTEPAERFAAQFQEPIRWVQEGYQRQHWSDQLDSTRKLLSALALELFRSPLQTTRSNLSR